MIALRRQFTDQLQSIYPEQEISSLFRIVIEDLTGQNWHQLMLNESFQLPEAKLTEFHQIIERLQNFEPIQYILGETPFYDQRILVNSSVLIPRPETEELVDWIVKSELPKNPNLLDIGTGSGCIAIALAKNIPGSHVEAWDISQSALETARKNAEVNNAEVTFLHRDVLNDPIGASGSFDLIVSNPPYVTVTEKTRMSNNVLNFEPFTALFVPDQDPLLFYRTIGKLARHLLKENGVLYFEINEQFGSETVDLLKQLGFEAIELRQDLQGKYRMIRALFKSE